MASLTEPRTWTLARNVVICITMTSSPGSAPSRWNRWPASPSSRWCTTADAEVEHFKDYARVRLERSGHAGGNTETTSLRRTSKQTWLEHRLFNLNVTEIMEKTGAGDQNEVMRTLDDDPAWRSFFMRRRDQNITDWTAYRVSERMERATTFSLFTPLSSEPYQVRQVEDNSS